MAKKSKRHGGANYTTLTEGRIISLAIPVDADEKQINGDRVLTFDVPLRTKSKDPYQFRFTCFSDHWQPSETITCRLKLGLRQMLNHTPQMYARCDETELPATHKLHLVDNERKFAELRGQAGAQAFAFVRDHHIGGAVLLPLTRPHY